jgi:phosphoribosylamine--glycine ligase
MQQDGITYTGFLYAGLMIDRAGRVLVLEFNCRMGDPETQPIMMRLKSDLLQLLWTATDPNTHQLANTELQWDRRCALGVVLAAANYPYAPELGQVIRGLGPDSEEAMVFHAGTVQKDGKLITSGGRVFCVTALGDTVKQAQTRAYELADKVHFQGMQMRRDIGYRAIRR